MNREVNLQCTLLDEYLAGSELLREAVSGLSAEQWYARPVAGMWSTLEVVCHLADSEALFAERIKRVLVEERPPLPFADPASYAEALAYHERKADDELALIGLIRRQVGRILGTAPPETWRRVGIHSTEGERTIEQLVRKAVDHLAHHVAILREKRALLERAEESS